MISKQIHTQPIADPRIIAAALTRAAQVGVYRAAAEHKVAATSIYAWRDYQTKLATEDRPWPTDADTATWLARRPVLARRRASGSRSRRRHLLGQPMRRMVPSTGVQRRLQALAALGWGAVQLAAELGVGHARVGHLVSGLHPTVSTDTDTAVRRLYDRLSMTPGPSTRAAARARAKAWPPPLAWDEELIDDPTAKPWTPDTTTEAPRGAVAIAAAAAADVDELAVEVALDGHRLQLADRELDIVVDRLTAQGHSRAAIADRLDVDVDVIRRAGDRLAKRRERTRPPESAPAAAAA